MIFGTLLGTLVLTNLMISFMTSEFHKVRQQAQKETLFAFIELTHDLSHRSRLFPPPLNIIVVAITCVVMLFGSLVTLINSTWNIYIWLNFGFFEKFRSKKYRLGYPLIGVVMLWTWFLIGIYFEEWIAVYVVIPVWLIFGLLVYVF